MLMVIELDVPDESQQADILATWVSLTKILDVILQNSSVLVSFSVAVLPVMYVALAFISFTSLFPCPGVFQ